MPAGAGGGGRSVLPDGPYSPTRRLGLIRVCFALGMHPKRLDRLEREHPQFVEDLLEADAIERAEKRALVERMEKVVAALIGAGG